MVHSTSLNVTNLYPHRNPPLGPHSPFAVTAAMAESVQDRDWPLAVDSEVRYSTVHTVQYSNRVGLVVEG